MPPGASLHRDARSGPPRGPRLGRALRGRGLPVRHRAEPVPRVVPRPDRRRPGGCSASPTARGATASGWRARASTSRRSTRRRSASPRPGAWRPSAASRCGTTWPTSTAWDWPQETYDVVVAIYVQFSPPAQRRRRVRPDRPGAAPRRALPAGGLPPGAARLRHGRTEDPGPALHRAPAARRAGGVHAGGGPLVRRGHRRGRGALGDVGRDRRHRPAAGRSGPGRVIAMAAPRIVVCGAGIVGASVAHFLALRGAAPGGGGPGPAGGRRVRTGRRVPRAGLVRRHPARRRSPGPASRCTASWRSGSGPSGSATGRWRP